MSVILTVAIAALAAATPIHSAEIAHGSSNYQASYSTQSTLRLRQVEPRFASRPATPVCRWQAELTIDRTLAAQGVQVVAFGKPIHRLASLSGSHAGPCAGARGQIEAEIARYSQSRTSEAMAVARQDRAVLLNELDGVRALNAGR